jgi:hypothetical protein
MAALVEAIAVKNSVLRAAFALDRRLFSRSASGPLIRASCSQRTEEDMTIATASNDQVRTDLLAYLYERHAHATSFKGKRGVAVGIAEIRSAMKERFGYKQDQVIANLHYLIQKGWVVEDIEERPFQTPQGATIPRNQTRYKISADGIDRVEGHSAFKEIPRFAGVNIQATGLNVVTVGDGNQVRADFAAVTRELAAFRAMIADSELSDIDKLSVLADVDGIGTQLIKPAPDKGVIGTLWEGIEKVVTGTQFAGIAAGVGRSLSDALG